MKLSAPKNATFIIALILGAVAIISHFIAIPFVSAYAFIILAVAFIIFVLACAFKGL